MAEISSQNLLDFVQKQLPWFEACSEPQRLAGGILNYVWRIEGKPRSLVVKYFAPHIASAPEIPLDRNRMLLEARCLQAFNNGGELETIATPQIRPPHLYYADETHHIVIMEEVKALYRNDLSAGGWGFQHISGQQAGENIGGFIGRLHAQSCNQADFAQYFNNFAIQKTRWEVQYCAIGDLLAKANIPDARTLGQKAEALGEKYLTPGKTLVMGDLWPPSVMPTAPGLRIIDWEFAHYGYPTQDIAHFAAHLWMLAHRAKTAEIAQQANHLLNAFLRSYTEALGETRQQLLDSEEWQDCAVHFAAEILVRTVGRFQSGYLYDGLSLEAPEIQEAVEMAASHLRFPEQSDIFFSYR